MGLNMGFDKGLDQCIIEAVDRLKDEMIDSILELVRIDSVEGEGSKEAPFGPGVKQALLSALDISRRLGFDTVNLDNYIGYAQYGRGSGRIRLRHRACGCGAGRGGMETASL